MKEPMFRWIREKPNGTGKRIGCFYALSPTQVGFALINTKKVERRVPCKTCKGTGAEVISGSVIDCAKCQGTGEKVILAYEQPNRAELIKYAGPRAEAGYVSSVQYLWNLMGKVKRAYKDPLWSRLVIVNNRFPSFLVRAVWYFGTPEKAVDVASSPDKPA